MAGKSVNKVILIGNLGKDPEVKFTPQGTPVAKFTLATNERFKDKDGNWQDRTEWHNLTAWARTAEIAGEYLKKGSKCYVEGSLRTHSWDDKATGQKKYMTEIVVNDLVLLGGRGEGGGGGDSAEAPAERHPLRAAATISTSVRPSRNRQAPAPDQSPTTTFRSSSQSADRCCRLILRIWQRKTSGSRPGLTGRDPFRLVYCACFARAFVAAGIPVSDPCSLERAKEHAEGIFVQPDQLPAIRLVDGHSEILIRSARDSADVQRRNGVPPDVSQVRRYST